MTVKERIEAYVPNMLEDLGRLVKYNSVNAPALPGMPFGKECADVLKEGLEIAEAMGFKTKNLDNYCGYAEIGEGDDIIGIAAHLDIVPAGDGWHTDPFTLTVQGDNVYGRGVTDDKGPIIANLYAVKILQEMGKKFNKRIRIIMGCNEETGSACMRHYAEVEEPLTLGYTPDGYFPGIFGEKGGMSMLVKSKNTKISYAKGGFVGNAVCHQCTLTIPASEVDQDRLRAALEKTPLKSFTLTEKDGDLTLFAEGMAAHASTPLLGINAASFAMQALEEAGFEDDFVSFYNDRVGTHCNGDGCGLNLKDEYGDLTFNNGLVYMEDGHVVCTIDIRVPVTVSEETLRTAVAPYLEDERGLMEILRIGEPLFFPVDSPLVKSLVSAYREVTGDTELEPMVIGGGTYAKALPGIIAFGAEWIDIDCHMHNADEFMILPDFKKSVEIYIKAIENLLDI